MPLRTPFDQASRHPSSRASALDAEGPGVTPHERERAYEARRERTEALGREMVTLCAHISAAEARFLELLAEFDREELWKTVGCYNAAHWLNWQCGIGAVAARERVRVARALEGLPLIRASFRRGEVSYSKVREMTRIAIPENEEALLMIARHGTAAHMQRLVRKYRRVEKLEAAAEAMAQYRRRYVHYTYDEDGMLVIEARLPSEIGEVVRKALDVAVEVLYRDGRRKRKESERGEDQNGQRTCVEHLGNGASPAPDAEASLTGGGVPTEALVVAPAEASPVVPAEASADVPPGASAHVPAEAPADVPAEASAGDAERLTALSGDNQTNCVREEQWLPVIRPYPEKDDEEDLARFAAWLDGKPVETDDDDPGSEPRSNAEAAETHSEDREQQPSRQARPVDASRPASGESASAEVAEIAEIGETAAATHAEEAAEAAPQVTSAPQPPPAAARSAFMPIPTPHEIPGGDSVVEEFEGEEWSESLGARRADAMRLLAESFLARGAEHVDTSADRYQVVVHIDHALLASEPAPGRSHADGVHGDGGTHGRHRTNKRHGPALPLFTRCDIENEALAVAIARRLACDAALVGIVEDGKGDPLNVGRKTRAISPALQRALNARDGDCRFPGCGRSHFLHYHHIIHWANGGETKLENLISLCTYHHALVHEGGFSIQRTANDGFAFFAPNGERLPESGRLDRHTIAELTQAAAREQVTLHTIHFDAGLEIDETTGGCLWSGERMDYHMAVGCLIWQRDKARAREQALH